MTAPDAEKRNVEFQQYSRMDAVYKENGIQAALLDAWDFSNRDITEEALLASMKRFHVVHLTTGHEGVHHFDDAHKKRAAIVGRALKRYVEEGGGLFLQPLSVRYPNTDDEIYWNAVLKPLGVEILHEGAFDKTRAFEGRTLGAASFWYTRNITAVHPVTKDVSQLYLPLRAFGDMPGLSAMQYSAEWQVLVRGEQEAKSYRSGIENAIDLDTEGTYAEAPPVLAVRELGKGRIVCYPISTLFTGINHRNPLWADIVEVNGDRAAGQPSDSMKMQMNAYQWLAEPARNLSDYGTYKSIPYKPVEFPATVYWDDVRFAQEPGEEQVYKYPDEQEADIKAPTDGVRGIFGLHSSYSDGKGTVAEYTQAAKAAGLSFIVFSDPLEALTEEKLNQLKADCAEVSKAGDFYACPGIEFTDGIGARWVFFGESVVFPLASFEGTSTGREYAQWDGKVVRHYGQFAAWNGRPGVALLDYKQFRETGAHPENLWQTSYYIPFAYDRDRLIADNVGEYLFGLRDMRWSAVASFTRTKDPSEVAGAAAVCFTGMRDLATTRTALNTRSGAEGAAAQAGQYVSQGPVIAAWQAVNKQMEHNWRHTRGAQRVKLRFVARSESGIAEVKVLDADHGPIRRFLGDGARELTREFELVQDQQHYLVLEVTDKAGKQAVSYPIRVYCYKAGLFRCGDNCNTLGATSLLMHPDRNQFLDAAKQFRNGSDYALGGWDTGSAGLGVPQPRAELRGGMYIKEVKGVYPNRPGTVIGQRLDMGINGHNLQIATMHMTHLSETYGTETRPSPYLASPPRDVEPLEYYESTHTLYAPMERVDMFTAWNYRRPREGRKDYRGGILWHEGEIRFKKDCTLQGSVPIPLLVGRCPTDLSLEIGEVFIVTDSDGSTQVGMVRDEKKPVRRSGRIRPGGYAAVMTTPVGYNGLLVPADMDFAYNVSLPGREVLRAGLGYDGQKIKAGTALKYRFGVGTFADEMAGSALLEHTVKAMNMAGGHDGYPVDMKAGEIEDATFFFTAKAKENEAAFTLGPQDLIIDLPIRVQCLDDNGCAAVYSTKRPWFRYVPVVAGAAYFQEPIDQANEMWVGNVFVCDNKAVKITTVIDGQKEVADPWIEAHNPTDKDVMVKLWSPEHAPQFGGLKMDVKIPAGDSIRLDIVAKKLVPRVN